MNLKPRIFEILAKTLPTVAVAAPTYRVLPPSLPTPGRVSRLRPRLLGLPATYSAEPSAKSAVHIDVPGSGRQKAEMVGDQIPPVFACQIVNPDAGTVRLPGIAPPIVSCRGRP